MADIGAVHHEEPRASRYTLLGGSAVEGLAGAAALVLAIIGLSGYYVPWMLAIATILVGVALIMEGAAASTRMARLMHETTGGKVQLSELGGGVSIEYLGGVVGIVLAIISIAGYYPNVLLPIAAIVFGGSHLLGSTVTANVVATRFMGENEDIRNAVTAASRSAANIQASIGAAGGVLGLLALMGFAPVVLCLIAMLIFGFADMMRTPALAGRMFTHQGHYFRETR